jgi:uncharacterized protein (TIGR00369 family)
MPDQQSTEHLHRAMPLCATLDATADGFGPEEVVLSMGWAAQLCTSGGLLHGGVLMALADSAGGACASLNLPEGAGTATIESKTTIVVETELRSGDHLVAKVTQTQAVLRPRR